MLYFLAYYGGYSYHGDHHMPSPPFYPSGFPGPYFMRGIPDPSSLGSPDYLTEHFQGTHTHHASLDGWMDRQIDG